METGSPGVRASDAVTRVSRSNPASTVVAVASPAGTRQRPLQTPREIVSMPVTDPTPGWIDGALPLRGIPRSSTAKT